MMPAPARDRRRRCRTTTRRGAVSGAGASTAVAVVASLMMMTMLLSPPSSPSSCVGVGVGFAVVVDAIEIRYADDSARAAMERRRKTDVGGGGGDDNDEDDDVADAASNPPRRQRVAEEEEEEEEENASGDGDDDDDTRRDSGGAPSVVVSGESSSDGVGKGDARDGEDEAEERGGSSSVAGANAGAVPPSVSSPTSKETPPPPLDLDGLARAHAEAHTEDVDVRPGDLLGNLDDSFFDPVASDPSCAEGGGDGEGGGEDCYSPPASTIETTTEEVLQIDATWVYGGDDVEECPDDDDDDDVDDDVDDEDAVAEVESDDEGVDGGGDDTDDDKDGSDDKDDDKSGGDDKQCKPKKKKNKKTVREVKRDKHWGSDLKTILMRDRLRAMSDDEDDVGKRADGKSGRPPVFLMPGLASTRLVSWRHKSCKALNALLSDIKVRDYVWLNMNLLLQMATIDDRCWTGCLTLGPDQGDGVRDIESRGDNVTVTGCKLRADEGLDAISSLAPGSATSNFLIGGTNTVYAWLTQWLADNLGYDVTSIVGLPYDWRLSPDVMERRDGFLTLTRRRIEAAVSSNGRPGVMVAHSMGNLVFRYFLEWLRVEMREEAFGKYVAQEERRREAERRRRREIIRDGGGGCHDDGRNGSGSGGGEKGDDRPGWLGGGSQKKKQAQKQKRERGQGKPCEKLPPPKPVRPSAENADEEGAGGTAAATVEGDGDDSDDGDADADWGIGERVQNIASALSTGLDGFVRSYFDPDDGDDDGDDGRAGGDGGDGDDDREDHLDFDLDDSDEGRLNLDGNGGTTDAGDDNSDDGHDETNNNNVRDDHDPPAATRLAELRELALHEGDAAWLTWIDEHIWTFVGLSAPLMGAIGPLRAVLSGEPMGLPLSESAARVMELSFGSTHTANPISTAMGFCDESMGGKRSADRGSLACLDELVRDIERSGGGGSDDGSEDDAESHAGGKGKKKKKDKATQKKDVWRDFPALRRLLLDRVDWDTDFPMVGVTVERCAKGERPPCVDVDVPLNFSAADTQSGALFRRFSDIWQEEGDPLGVKHEQLRTSWWDDPPGASGGVGGMPNPLNSTWDRPHIKHVIMAYGVDIPTEAGYMYRKSESAPSDEPPEEAADHARVKQYDPIPAVETVIMEESGGILMEESLLIPPGTKKSFTETLLKRGGGKPRRRPFNGGDGAGSHEHSGDGTITYLSLSWAHTWLLHANRAMRHPLGGFNHGAPMAARESGDDRQRRGAAEERRTARVRPDKGEGGVGGRENPLDSIRISHRPRGGSEWIYGSRYDAEGEEEEEEDGKEEGAAADKKADEDTGTSHPHGTKYKPEMVRFQSSGTSRSTGIHYTTTVIEAIGVEHKETTRNYDILAAVFTDVLKHMHDDFDLV